ncbi:DNA translocase FtsK [Salinisphaera sp. PC39]|uniref:DNA translocase FtsK n=1 Tax=Salinisphaera sp. PC39 TaxID=1304156 RepID=UPI003342E0A1
MARAPQRRAAAAQSSRYRQRLGRLLREAVLFAAAALTLFLLAALVSYDPADPGWSRLGQGGPVNNLFGVPGAWFGDVLLSLFGYLGFVFPWLILYGGWLVFLGGRQPSGDAFSLGVRSGSLLLWLTAGCGLVTLAIEAAHGLPQGSGGILGASVAGALRGVFNTAGTAWLLITVFVITLSTGLGFSWLNVAERVGTAVLEGGAWLWRTAVARWREAREKRAERRRKAAAAQAAKPAKPAKPRREPKLPAKSADKGKRAAQLDLPMDPEPETPTVPAYDPGKDSPLPPTDLLDSSRQSVRGYAADELERLSGELEQHLADFGVQAKVVDVQPGPVVTRFELDPAPGVKVNQFTNLAKDLARAMSTISVRVVEVIPGKSVVGLEIPNQEREIVALRELFESRHYANGGSALTLALGKDIGGGPVTADLGKMPHLLVAGTTGSGKSVAINVMILSMLYKATAEQVRFIMIDPKMLELSVYEGIPHLLAPVVTDMKEAANALRWCVAEMERRYKLMSSLGVRNIAGFNRKVSEAAARGKPIPDPLVEAARGDDDDTEVPTLEPLPAIVVIVDELADLMMVVGKKVEELIARLAQKARAAGLHMILATQRPSVDVITGLIKANIPTRIAFQVASRVDSRTILDQQGAESLLGHGDMLFLPPGTGMPARVHGAFVDDHEVHKVVEYLKQVGAPDYNEEILAGVPESDGGGGAGGDGEEDDPLYDQAVAVVTQSRKASISYVQRRLRVGYNRAARLVEQMEAAGVVGPLEGGGSREVLAPPPPAD